MRTNSKRLTSGSKALYLRRLSSLGANKEPSGLADIFVSYASSDRDRVEPLVDQLESSGFSVWWDSHLRGGSMFATEIQSELETAKAVLCVWTTPALTSHWVADEAEFGADRQPGFRV